MEIAELSRQIKQLDTGNRIMLIREILTDDAISITDFIVAKIANLEEFRDKARRDLPRVAEAGLELGEKEMRKVTGIGGHTRRKTDTFKLSMVKCLLEAGGYRGTEYGKQIASADFSSIDEDWYNWSWRPQLYKEPTND